MQEMEAVSLGPGSYLLLRFLPQQQTKVIFVAGPGQVVWVESNRIVCRMDSGLHQSAVLRIYLKAMQCASDRSGEKMVAGSGAAQAVFLIVIVVALRHQRASEKAVCSQERKKADRYAATLMQVNWRQRWYKD